MVEISPRDDVPFKTLLAYRMFKKTGVMPKGVCFDAEYFQKAANEADFDEMAEGYSAYNREKEAQDIPDYVSVRELERDPNVRDPEFLKRLYQFTNLYAPTNADIKAQDAYRKKELKPVGKLMQDEIQRAIPNIQRSIQEGGSDYADLAPVMHAAGHHARNRAMDKLIAEGNPKNMRNFSHSNDLYDYLRTAATNIFSKRLNLSDEDLDDLVSEFMDTFDGDWMDLYLKQMKK